MERRRPTAERVGAAVERAGDLVSRSEDNLAGAQAQIARQSEELAQLRDKVANLEIALETNRRIAVAVGILMTRHLVVEDAEAFQMLVTCSQQSHRKLREVAEAAVTTGEVPSVA